MEAKEEKEVLAITMSPSLSVERKKVWLNAMDGFVLVHAKKKPPVEEVGSDRRRSLFPTFVSRLLL